MSKHRAAMLFEDVSGIRRHIWIAFICITLLISILWVADFLYRVSTLPPVSNPLRETEEAVGTRTSQVEWKELALRSGGDTACVASPQKKRASWAFLPAHDPRAVASTVKNCAALTGIIQEAFVIAEENSNPILTSLYDELPETPAELANFLSIRPVAGTDAATLEALLNSIPTERLNTIETTTNGGVCLDLTESKVLSPKVVSGFINRLAFPSNGLPRKVCLIAGPQSNVWDDKALVRQLDMAVVTGFTAQNGIFDPLAPIDWFETSVSAVEKKIPKSKRIIALGSYGKFWKTGQSQPQNVSYTEAMWLASNHQADLYFAAEQKNTQIEFLDNTLKLNRIWLLDAGSFYSQVRTLPLDQPIAIWPVGSEDPAIWSILANENLGGNLQHILNEPLLLNSTVIQDTNSTLTTDIANPVTGQRQFTLAEDGELQELTYLRMPRPTRMHGLTSTDTNADVVLTFNGLVTGALRDKLRQVLDGSGIRAAFFVSDLGALKQGRALQELADDGHHIGALVSRTDQETALAAAGTKFNKNGTQFAITHLAGRSAALIRSGTHDLTHPVFLGDVGLTSDLIAEGYLPVSTGLSWHGDPDSQENFIQRIRQSSASGTPTVLTLDLTGPFAEILIEELGKIVTMLQHDGFRFQSIETLSGIEGDRLSPVGGTTFPFRDGINFGVLHFWYFELTGVFFTLLCIAVVRSSLHLALAFTRKSAPSIDPEYTPGVTIVVPAYNEAKVIVRSINSILQSDYPNFKILVIDDGSSDGTADEVKTAFASNGRVKLLEQENGGKWQAENNAINHIDTPFFIGVDADTILAKDAISHLVQQFKDPKVGAVAGLVEVGNPNGFLTSCQSLEYIVSQAVTRRAFETFNGIFVVPGAIGAWRLDAVSHAGNYSGDTITEDADLTVAVHRAGYRVKFQENARAYTEAPEQVAAFMQQRLRWTLGMLQTSWKHRKSIAEGRAIGIVSIIDAIWFSLLTSILSPLVDLLLFGILVKAIFLFSTQGSAGLEGFPLVILASYLLLMALDIINTLAAFWFEKKFDAKLLLLTPILRFGYRQLLYISTLKALWHAITGRLPGWQKLERSAARLISETEQPVAELAGLKPEKTANPIAPREF